MIVALLADQTGDYVEQNQDGDKTWFAVGRGFEDNVLLKAFHQGVVRLGPLGDRTSDRFQEEAKVGLDQLLMVRLAQCLAQLPDKLRGKETGGDRISNQRPIADKATRCFSEDIRRFVHAYAEVVPRHAFVELLESCMAVGLTSIVTSTIDILFDWAVRGEIRKSSEQHPAAMLVDCTNGVNLHLRGLAEQSLDEFFRKIERFPVVLMALRLLDYSARYDPRLRKISIPTRPYATEWLNLLGELLFQRRPEAAAILYDLERKSQELAERLEEDYPDAAQLLQDESAQSNPVWRISEALTLLQGRKSTQSNVQSMIDSALMTNRPHGLAAKRAVTRKLLPGETAKKRDVRSLVMTDAVLDYLVHRNIIAKGSRNGYQPLPFRSFLSILSERHGFFVDVAPPGMVISNELLHANRVSLERRLRDLGLLVGVNDAEAMKHLRPRFESREAVHGLE